MPPGGDPRLPHVTTCFLLLRVVCVIPAVVAAPPSLWVARPPSLYSHRMRLFRHRLREHTAPYAQQLRRATTLLSLRFPELRLVQLDSGTRGPCAVHVPQPLPGQRDTLGVVLS